MDLKFLDFEQPIAELEAKIDELRFVADDSEININDEIRKLKGKRDALIKTIFSKLSAWQVAQVARHPMRPYTADYLEAEGLGAQVSASLRTQGADEILARLARQA